MRLPTKLTIKICRILYKLKIVLEFRGDAMKINLGFLFVVQENPQ